MKKFIILLVTFIFTSFVYAETTWIKINKKDFPLPLQYKTLKTSEQGLREAIPNVDGGGGFSLATYHNAIDYASPDKTEVYACDYGYVINVYPSYYNGGAKFKGHPTYGGLIEIRHFDGTTSLYAHLSMTLVTEGTYVSRGQKIGLSGGVKGRRGSGNSTGPHLHFAIYVNIEDIIKE